MLHGLILVFFAISMSVVTWAQLLASESRKGENGLHVPPSRKAGLIGVAANLLAIFASGLVNSQGEEFGGPSASLLVAGFIGIFAWASCLLEHFINWLGRRLAS